jgi:hypothetical protein
MTQGNSPMHPIAQLFLHLGLAKDTKAYDDIHDWKFQFSQNVCLSQKLQCASISKDNIVMGNTMYILQKYGEPHELQHCDGGEELLEHGLLYGHWLIQQDMQNGKNSKDTIFLIKRS